MQTPSAADFQASRVTNPGQSEVIRQRLYDYLLYPTAGQPQLNFFSQPAGQGLTSSLGAAAGGSKTQFDTNLVLPNQLPSGVAYMVESIEVLFMPGSVSTANTYTPNVVKAFAAAAALTVGAYVNDVNTIYQSGMLEFNVLQKNYVRETPLLAFPPKAMFDLSAAEATNSATVGEVAMALMKVAGRPYYLDPVVTIQPAVNFDVTVRWPAAVATPTGFNGRIGVIFDGYMMRASQ